VPFSLLRLVLGALLFIGLALQVSNRLAAVPVLQAEGTPVEATSPVAGEAGGTGAPVLQGASGAEVLLAAGDVAGCSPEQLAGAEATARLLDQHEGTVAMVGDAAYDAGTEAEFAHCYGPTWGRHLARTRPAPGNHEYGTSGAAGYFRYFGARAGDPAKGYYDYTLGAWHVVVLNSNCAEVGGCQAGSAQEGWLRAALAERAAQLDQDPGCTLAYMHHPRFTSGPHGDQPEVEALWRALFDAGAEVVLAAHDHHYERLAPLTPSGDPDPQRGIRSFVVGTGGNYLRPLPGARPHSEARHADGHGVLKLTLGDGGYEWEFLAAAGQPFSDTGSGRCS
jgi:acid phosphatase type 7